MTSSWHQYTTPTLSSPPRRPPNPPNSLSDRASNERDDIYGMVRWRTLPVVQTPSLPPLLVSSTFDASSYRVLVTDLVHVWAEDVDRRAICMRGWKQNTIIDPSDTHENMDRLLTCLRSALDDTHPDHGSTRARLSGCGDPEAGEDGIVFEITCHVAGLGMLKWPMYMKKASPTVLSAELVLPLIRTQSNRARELDDLVTLLRHKDKAITKLYDALDASNIGLEKAFPALGAGAVGRCKITRALAQNKIQGLAPFDMKQGKKGRGSTSTSIEPDGVNSLVDDVFGAEGLRYEPSRDKLDVANMDGWWRGYQGAVGPSRGAKKPTPSPSPLVEHDDDFQGPTTPEHLPLSRREQAPTPIKDNVGGSDTADGDSPSSPISPAMKSTPRNVTPAKRESPAPDDSGHDDDDDDFQRQVTPPQLKSKASPPQKFPARVGGALGGGARKFASGRSPSPNAAAPADDEDETASEATASGREDDDYHMINDKTASPKPPSSISGPGPKKGLGRIGGKTAASPAPAKSPEPKPEPTPALARRLGKIGGKIGGETSTEAMPPTRGRSGEPSAKEDAPAVRETSEERANRRREQVRAERDRKAATGPVKKKRRF